MKNIRQSKLLKLFAAAALFVSASCSEIGHDWDKNKGYDTDDLYEITDGAFAEHLIYNSNLADGSPGALPKGIVVKDGTKTYISKSIAATITTLTLAQPLVGEGKPSGKITSLNGIELFTELEALDITGNSITGTLDLTKITALRTLAMNGNLVSELMLPPSVRVLEYSAAQGATEEQKLSGISLWKLTLLEKLSLPGHNITTGEFIMPSVYPPLTGIDMSDNPGAPFAVPQDVYDNLDSKAGVEPFEPIDPAQYYELRDLAFAEYLAYNTTLASDNENRLPANIVIVNGGAYFLDKTIAATVTRLYISKSSSSRTALRDAGVATADEVITDLAGIEFFTSLETFIGTNNNFGTTLKTSTMPNLLSLTAGSAGVTSLDLSNNVGLVTLSVNSSSLDTYTYGRLESVNLLNNTALESVQLMRNHIDPQQFALPSSYASLTTLQMGDNRVGGQVVTYKVPQALYDALGAHSGIEVAGNDDYLGPMPKDDYYLIDNKPALAEYYVYLSRNINDISDDFKSVALVEGTAFVYGVDGKTYIDKAKAAQATKLSLNKTSATRGQLEAAGLATAQTTLSSVDGIQFFTNIDTLMLTSNVITGTLDLRNHTKLLVLEMNGNKVTEMHLPASIKRFRYQGNNTVSDRMPGIDLSGCTNLEHIRLDRHRFTQESFILPSDYSKLKFLQLGSMDAGVNITVPAALYDGLTDPDASNKAGVVRGN